MAQAILKIPKYVDARIIHCINPKTVGVYGRKPMVVEKVDSLEHLGASELRGFCRISRTAFARIS